MHTAIALQTRVARQMVSEPTSNLATVILVPGECGSGVQATLLASTSSALRGSRGDLLPCSKSASSRYTHPLKARGPSPSPMFASDFFRNAIVGVSEDRQKNTCVVYNVFYRFAGLPDLIAF